MLFCNLLLIDIIAIQVQVSAFLERQVIVRTPTLCFLKVFVWVSYHFVFIFVGSAGPLCH